MRRVREEIRRIVREEIARAMGFTRRAPVLGDEVKGGIPYATLQGYQSSASYESLQAAVLESFGHASRPPAELPALLVKSGGQWVLIAVEDRLHRPTLTSGEMALYNAHGALVHLAETGEIVMNSGADAVAAEGDTCTFNLLDGDSNPVTGTIEIAPTGRTVKV